MANIFRSDELFEIAVEMERAGSAYYEAVAEKVTEKCTMSVFRQLAAAEKRHLRTFRRMLRGSAKSSPPESYRGEYRLYMAALLREKVFPGPGTAKSRGIRSNPQSALNTGIRAEKDSILFYSGLLDIVHPDHKTAINKILAEEKRHLRKLLDYKYNSLCFA